MGGGGADRRREHEYHILRKMMKIDEKLNILLSLGRGSDAYPC